MVALLNYARRLRTDSEAERQQRSDWETFRFMIDAQSTVRDVKEGWICPRCGKVNAPFMPNCDCKLDETVSNADSECGCGGKHERHKVGRVDDAK